MDEEDYVAEAEAEAVAPPATIAVTGGEAQAMSPLEANKKKRKAEVCGHASTMVWKQHFIVLDEFHYSSKGKQGHRLGYCRYCHQAATSPSAEQLEVIAKSFKRRAPPVPESMQIYKKICQVHLSKCKWLPRELKLIWQVSAKAKAKPPPHTQ